MSPKLLIQRLLAIYAIGMAVLSLLAWIMATKFDLNLLCAIFDFPFSPSQIVVILGWVERLGLLSSTLLIAWAEMIRLRPNCSTQICRHIGDRHDPDEEPDNSRNVSICQRRHPY